PHRLRERRLLDMAPAHRAGGGAAAAGGACAGGGIVNTAETLNLMMMGAIAVASFAIGIVFWRYWRTTGDRFFLLFSLSFVLESLNRVHMGLVHAWSEDSPLQYGVRLVSYTMYLVAV